jgi:LPS sulfotransferase NodH
MFGMMIDKLDFIGMVPSSYLICATPRSGSTLLCAVLGATGVAGRPAEYFEILRHSGLPREPREYFDGEEDREVLAMLPDAPGSRRTGSSR